MREIKFRAWHVESKTMVNFDMSKVINDKYQQSHLCKLIAGTHEDGFLMQFTEIRDCDGVEIYFGDIVKIYGYGNLHVDSLGDLMLLVDALSENDIGEILGNIYENKDLIEDNK